jgi:hypothetical protein
LLTLGWLAFVVFLPGCGTAYNTVRIKTEPAGAQLYVNDKYVGLTPQEVKETQPFPYTTGENLRLKFTKDGYQTKEETILFSDMAARYWAGDFQAGSKYGSGQTWNYSYVLAPSPTAPAAPRERPALARPSVSAQPVRHSPPPPSTPRPKTAEPWR